MRVERITFYFERFCPNDYLFLIVRMLRIDHANCCMASLLVLPRYDGEYYISRELPRSNLLFLLPGY